MSIFKEFEDIEIVSDRSAGDRKRHREKVRNAIKENLGNIIAEEAIIGQSGDKKIKVPIKGIKEYRFVYGNNSPGAAQGEGDEQEGDILDIDQQKDPGAGHAGSDPGEDIYETEIELNEIIELLFEDLELPDMEKKKFQYTITERNLKIKGHRRHGIRVRLDKKKTVLERLKRKQGEKRAENEKKIEETKKNNSKNAELKTAWPIIKRIMPGGIIIEEKRFPFHNDDLRYDKTYPKPKKQSNAVVFCIMDTSGSMDMTKKYLARSFYFLLYRFILFKYQNTEVVFISHHTEAQEVTEDDFFHKGESGGTKISSGYKKSLEIINARYNPDLWNIYAFHCSDGDNFDEDNEEAVRQAEELAKIANLFGYGEIKPQGSYAWSSMIEKYAKLTNDPDLSFVTVKIHEKKDLWPAFNSFIGKDKDKIKE